MAEWITGPNTINTNIIKWTLMNADVDVMAGMLAAGKVKEPRRDACKGKKKVEY